MTFKPLTKDMVERFAEMSHKAEHGLTSKENGNYADGYLRCYNDVFSAVEGLREELRKRPPMPADVNWEAGHRKAQQRALYLLDKWFPVFSQSLSEDAKINDSCSQQATSAPSSEAKSSVSHHVSMGAATESVALCSSVWEDNDMLVNCELPRGHEGEHRVNGDLGFHWKNDSEQTSTLTCICGNCDLSRVPSVEEIKQLLSQPNGSISSEEYGCRQCGGAGELSSVSVGEVDVKHAARKGCTCARCSHLNHVVHDDCGCECHKKEGEKK